MEAEFASILVLTVFVVLVKTGRYAFPLTTLSVPALHQFVPKQGANLALYGTPTHCSCHTL